MLNDYFYMNHKVLTGIILEPIRSSDLNKCNFD